jgi:DNA repair protein RecO (recombination protein O)
MLHAARGIVFHTIKYSETSVIVKIYTDFSGIRSYMARGVRSTKSRTRPGLFQPLTLLDLVVYHRERNSIQSFREVKLAIPYRSIPFDVNKSSVALFINELMFKSIREEEPNPELFSFLWQSCRDLDELSVPAHAFHLYFTARLMHYLGFFPHDTWSDAAPFFNLREGVFQTRVPDHPQYLDEHESRMLHTLLASCPAPSCEATSEWYSPSLFPDGRTRKKLLDILLLYYQLHLPGFSGMQSHLVLHDVFA